MNTSSARILSSTALLALLAWAPLAHALSPAPDLPPGTFHELRVRSITALTVAQQITQPSICGNPGTCLHDEVRVGVVIDFDAGLIVIDARAPEDENGNPVLPHQPGAILFNTLSGPVELRFAEPCINPDGCPLGEAVYFGTIDQGGNVSFESIGLDFELFGVSPISRFRGPMGTGPSTDPADPNVVAEGAPLDFATGALDLAGVDFIPAPIVGTTLQLNHIRGTLSPVPIPPVESRDLLSCQGAVQKAGATFVRTKQAALQKCVGSLLACEVAQEAGGAAQPECVARATDVCDRMVVRAIRAEQALSRQVVRGCKNVGPANMVAIEGGLGFSLVKPQCDALDISTSTREDIALCLGRSLSCAAEELAARVEPRAFEVLATHGYGALVQPAGCVPELPAGDASGQDATAVLRCQGGFDKQGAKYVKTKQLELQACLQANLACHLGFELETPGTLDPDCVLQASERCDRALAKIAAARTSHLKAVQRACVALDQASIPGLRGGLGFAALDPLCSALDPPATLATLDEVIDCTRRSLDCSIEGIARSMVPRGHHVLHHHGLDAVTDANPCLHPGCGDGLLDPGEECDPLFDPDAACNADCTLVVCGDGLQQGAEECDDGNTQPNDGCSATCTDEPFACGNGIVEHFAGEVCDDSDSAAGDGCNASCQSNETCGNGVVDTIRGETCDDGGTGFATDGDGCSADCRSNETCGNGVVDAVGGEDCDDGNLLAGDGCDASCALEACSFSSTPALGTRPFSIDPAGSGLFNSLIGLGAPVGSIGVVSGPLSLTAGAPDAAGVAPVTLDADVIVTINVGLGGQTQCLKFEAAGTTGSLACCGGRAAGISNTRDSNTGGLPPTGGQNNGPAIQLAGVGSGGIGDLVMAFQVRQAGGPLGTDCLAATYGAASLQYWTTGTATGRVLRPLQGGPMLEFGATGEAFSCAGWTTENGPGKLVSADTALNAVANVADGANLRRLDD